MDLPPPAPHDDVRIALELEIPSDVRYIEHVVELVRRQCCLLSFQPRHCSLNVPVALSEALSNAILRGNREDLAKHVRLRAEVDRRALVLEVGDDGPGFDLENRNVDPTDDEHIEREDGRGIFLMQRLMDRVERLSERGNVVRLTLNRV